MQKVYEVTECMGNEVVSRQIFSTRKLAEEYFKYWMEHRKFKYEMHVNELVVHDSFDEKIV